MVLEMMMIHHFFVLENIFTKGWDDSAIPDCTFHWMDYYWGWACEMYWVHLLIPHDNWQPGALFNQVVLTVTKDTNRTTCLDSSGAEDCAPLLISKTSSFLIIDVILASVSKLGLIPCIPPLLMVVVVVGCLTSTGSISKVFSATTLKNCHASLMVLLVNDLLQSDSIMVLVG